MSTNSPADHLWNRIGLGWKIFGVVLVLAGAPATFVGLWRVFHHEHVTPAIEEAVVAAHPATNVSLATFLADNAEFSSQSFTETQRNTKGDVFTLDFRVVGLEGKTVTLRWFPIAESNGQPLPWPAWAPRAEPLEPSSSDFAVHTDVWAPTPNGSGGRFIERFRIVGPSSVLKEFEAGPLGFFNP